MIEFFPGRLGPVVLAAAVSAVVACSAGTTTTGTGTGGADGGTTDGTPTEPSPATSCKASFAASQSLSEPCCTERGPDACGAGLFCAAFDGRKQATCYAEHSRLGGDACTSDVQCVGRACDESGVCKGTPYGKCSPAIGCGRAPGTEQPYFCDAAASSGPTCHPCTSQSSDPACESLGPPHDKCVPTCKTDADCESSCPVRTTATCCDRGTGQCYVSSAPKCPAM